MGSTAPLSAETAAPFQHYKLSTTNYLESGGKVVLMSWHCIHNISVTSTIGLGPVYVFTTAGLSDEYTLFEGFVGTVVEPLGSFCFRIDDTGAPPTIIDGHPGPHMIGITWNGSETDAEISGTVTSYNSSGISVGIRSHRILN
jgi:hypothetical protein